MPPGFLESLIASPISWLNLSIAGGTFILLQSQTLFPHILVIEHCVHHVSNGTLQDMWWQSFVLCFIFRVLFFYHLPPPVCELFSDYYWTHPETPWQSLDTQMRCLCYCTVVCNLLESKGHLNTFFPKKRISKTKLQKKKTKEKKNK